VFASVGQDHPERADGWPGILADAQLQRSGSAKCELLDLLTQAQQHPAAAFNHVVSPGQCERLVRGKRQERHHAHRREQQHHQ